METKEVTFNGKKINIVTKLDTDFKNYVIPSEYTEDNTKDLTNIIEQTQVINMSGDIDE